MKLEFILGLIAGVLGIIFAVITFVVGFVGGIFRVVTVEEVLGITIAQFLLSIVTIIGAIYVRSKPRIGGVTMLLAGILGLPVIRVIYVSPFISIVAGLIALVRRAKRGASYAVI